MTRGRELHRQLSQCTAITHPDRNTMTINLECVCEEDVALGGFQEVRASSLGEGAGGRACLFEGAYPWI